MYVTFTVIPYNGHGVNNYVNFFMTATVYIHSLLPILLQEEDESEEEGPGPEEIQSGLVTPSEGLAIASLCENVAAN